MYFKKSPEFLQEFVELIRIAKKFFEKIFLIEIKLFALDEKIPSVKNIFEGGDENKPYHTGWEISKIIKTFIDNYKHLNFYKKSENYKEKMKFVSFLHYVLKSRNSIAHNKITEINKESFLKQAEAFEEILIESEIIYSLNLKKKYVTFLANLKIKLAEKIKNQINEYFKEI